MADATAADGEPVPVVAPVGGRRRSPGRGRPALFHTAARQRYLTARQQGATQKAAAELVGVAAKTVRDARTSNPQFRALDDQAADIGRQARIDNLSHGESRYNNHKCRCPICTKAASAARAGRPDRARKEAHVVPINTTEQGSSSLFLAARAS